MERYIYSGKDICNAIEDVNEDTINLGGDLLELFITKVQKNLSRYANLYRFYDRNCCGCVGSNKECDFAYGRGRAEVVACIHCGVDETTVSKFRLSDVKKLRKELTNG